MQPQPHRALALAAAALAVVLAACTERADLLRPEPSAPDAPAPRITVDCTVDTRSLSVQCGKPAAPGGASPVIIGGQHTYVTLTSSNVAVTADTVAFDVTLTNLIPQPLGTTNGTSADPAGIRVFFMSGPTSTAPTGGTVEVANPDGTGVFTASSQPYFQYTGLLARNSTTGARRWKIRFSPQATTFSFTVLMSAAVPYPNGYIDGHPYVLTLDPNESRTLGGVVRNVVGAAQPGQTISWTSNAPLTAAISGSQVTAGASRGFADLTAQSGLRPAVYTTAVSVCQSAVVTSGTSLPSSISSSDCFSSFGSSSGRPSTSYYSDLYRVTLTAGQTLTVTMDSGDDLDTYLILAGPSIGQIVTFNDDDDDGILGVGSKMTYVASVTGVYVIEASTFNGLDAGNYTLGVTIS